MSNDAPTCILRIIQINFNPSVCFLLEIFFPYQPPKTIHCFNFLSIVNTQKIEAMFHKCRCHRFLGLALAISSKTTIQNSELCLGASLATGKYMSDWQDRPHSVICHLSFVIYLSPVSIQSYHEEKAEAELSQWIWECFLWRKKWRGRNLNRRQLTEEETEIFCSYRNWERDREIGGESWRTVLHLRGDSHWWNRYPGLDRVQRLFVRWHSKLNLQRPQPAELCLTTISPTSVLLREDLLVLQSANTGHWSVSK